MKEKYEHEFKNGKCVKCNRTRAKAINSICAVIGKEEVADFRYDPSQYK